jgi:hypothetical protein
LFTFVFTFYLGGDVRPHLGLVRKQVGGGGGQPGVDGGNAAAEGGAGLPGPRPRPTAERELEPREGVRRGATTSRAWQTVLQ